MAESLSYADRVLRDAMLMASGGVDLDTASRAIGEALSALEKIAAQLNAEPFRARMVQATCVCGKGVAIQVAPRPEELARSASHVAKTVDEIARLVAFSKGQPDSRPGGRDGRDVLRLLTDEQMRQVERWLEEAAVRQDGEADRR